jgi:predicted phosphodiesterase
MKPIDMNSSEKQISALFLVLSDLHFGPHPMSEGLPPLLESSFRAKANERVTNFFDNHCIGHDVEILAMLPEYLKVCLQRYAQRGFSRANFDACLLLGDLVTYPDGRAFNFLKQYLGNGFSSKESGLGISLDGLKFLPNQITAIPGNHDKLLRRNLSAFNAELSTILQGSQPLRGCLSKKGTFEGRDFIILQADANVYATQDFMLDLDSVNYLAKGNITKELIESINKQLEDQFPKSCDVSRLNDSRIILLIHYAIDHKEVRGSSKSRLQRWGLSVDELISLECEGVDSLLESINPRVDLVLHGHWHIPHIYRRTVPIISAGSTSQKDNAENGFFTLAFDTDGNLFADHHIWRDGTFQLDKTRSRYIDFVEKVPGRADAVKKTI